MSLRFYLGTHMPSWLTRLDDVPLFVSHRRLRGRKSRHPRATTPWALDSGGFTELSMHGGWQTTPDEYLDAVRRYDAEIGHMEWAAPQDWMCEPWIIAKTGKTIAEHQALTIGSYLALTAAAPDLGFVPVLQGWTVDDYHDHADQYAEAGVDLASQPLVGVGSVCRRQSTTEIAVIFETLASRGLSLHGFGVKTAGLAAYSRFLASADSLSWSTRGRRTDGGECGLQSCANCLHFALDWRTRVIDAATRDQQLTIDVYTRDVA